MWACSSTYWQLILCCLFTGEYLLWKKTCFLTASHVYHQIWHYWFRSVTCSKFPPTETGAATAFLRSWFVADLLVRCGAVLVCRLLVLILVAYPFVLYLKTGVGGYLRATTSRSRNLICRINHRTQVHLASGSIGNTKNTKMNSPEKPRELCLTMLLQFIFLSYVWISV